MVVFDTDVVSLIQRQSGSAFRAIEAHMLASEDQEFYSSIITFEEQMRGWLAAIAKARSSEAEVAAYTQLLRMVDYFRSRPLLPFNASASLQLQELKRLKLRTGTMDLKIAAVALANDATLVSRNVADFARIPRLRVKDWTK